MDKKKISIVLGFVCLLVSIAIAIQIRTITATMATSDPTFENDELRDDVLRWKDRYNEAYEELGRLTKELEVQRGKATENDTTLEEKEEQLKTGAAALGTTEATGKGIIITLKDNSNIKVETLGVAEDPNKYIIHDEDILNVVNELKNAGAEAISVNGQRIVSSSSIVCIGNVIKVNGEKVGAPFVIKAIGNQETLYYALTRVGGYIELLTPDVDIKIERPINNIIVEKYSGTFKAKYMREVK